MWGGGSHNEGIDSSDPDVLFLIPAMGIDPSGGTGIHTNTSTKKRVKRYSPSIPTFYSYFLAIPKIKLKHQRPIMARDYVQKDQYSITAA